MKNYKDSFYVLTIFILIILLTFGYVYYSSHTSRLEKKIKNYESKPTVIKTKPKLQDSIPASVSSDGTLVPKVVLDTLWLDGGTTIINTIEYDTITEPFDTIAFLQDYLSMKTYMDSMLIQDVEIQIKDTLQFNSLKSRSISVKNLRDEDFYKTRKFYIGGTMGGSSDLFMIGPTISYADKSNNLFSGSYLINPDNSAIFFSYQRKISLKRNK